MIDFFFPPKPIRIWPDADLFKSIDQNPNWIGEIKYNGWRLLLFKIDGYLLIKNNHGSIIDIDPKPFIPHFDGIPDNTVFDGELVDKRTKDLKNIMVFWDTCFYNGKDLRNLPLKTRRQYLDHFATAPLKLVQSEAQVYKVAQFKSGTLIRLYHQVEARNNSLEEGIVLKNTLAKYTSHPKRCIDIIDWIKIKKPGEDTKI